MKDHAHRGAHGQEVIFIRRVHAVNIHLAAGRQQDGIEELGQRALARAVRPHDGVYLTRLDRKVDSFQYLFAIDIGM